MSAEQKFMRVLKAGIFCYSDNHKFYVSNLATNQRMLEVFVEEKFIIDYNRTQHSGFDVYLNQAGMDLKSFMDL